MTGLVIAMVITNGLTALLCFLIKIKSGIHAIVDAQIRGSMTYKHFTSIYVHSFLHRLLHSWSEKEKDTVITPFTKYCVCVCVGV